MFGVVQTRNGDTMKMRRGQTEVVYDFLVTLRDFPQKSTTQKIAFSGISFQLGYHLVKQLKMKGLITYDRPRKRMLNLRLTDEGREFARSAGPIIKFCAEVFPV